jgi:hypothetical protein
MAADFVQCVGHATQRVVNELALEGLAETPGFPPRINSSNSCGSISLCMATTCVPGRRTQWRLTPRAACVMFSALRNTTCGADPRRNPWQPSFVRIMVQTADNFYAAYFFEPSFSISANCVGCDNSASEHSDSSLLLGYRLVAIKLSKEGTRFREAPYLRAMPGAKVP